MGFRFRCARFLLPLVVFAAGGGLLVDSATAQSSFPASADSLSFRPLRDVLYQVQAATGIDLYYDATLIEGKRTVSVSHPENYSAKQLLDHILAGTGLYCYRLTSGTFAIKAIPSRDAAPGNIQGLVYDATTGTPLPNAHVWLFTDTDRGTITDARGHFSFDRIAPGEYQLRISYLGYDPQDAMSVVLPTEDTVLNVELVPRPVVISPIIVEGLQAPARVLYLNDDQTQDDLNPARGYGTSDAVRGLAEIMGVRTGDATADIHIQGGETGEHQFRLDGVPVFEPVHLRGLLGAFNPFALERITVHKAGFAASEGSQISGVIRAEHALTSPDGRVIDIQVDPLSVNARLTGVVGNPEDIHAQVMAAVRTSVWDIYSPTGLDSLFESWNAPDPFLLRASLLALQESGQGPTTGLGDAIPDSSWNPNRPDLGFLDIHSAFRLRLNRHRTVHGSFYRSSNNMSADRNFAPPSQDTLFVSQDLYQWWNTTAQINYSDLIGSRAYWFIRLRNGAYRLSHGYLSLNNEEGVAFPGGFLVASTLKSVDDGNKIFEQAAELELDYGHGAHLFRVGVEALRTRHRFSLSDVYLTTLTSEGTRWQWNSFAEDQMRLGPLQFTAGSRFTYLPQHNEVYLEPRFETRYDGLVGTGGTFSARLAGGLYRQFVNQFDISSVSPSALLPGVRFWIPVDTTIAPAKAYHLAADVLWQVTPSLAFRLETYYKDQPHILAINYPALIGTPAETPPQALGDTTAIVRQSDFLRDSHGYAYGSAFAAEHSGDILRLAARYEYSVAKREYAFEGENGVEASLEVAPWNVPHAVDLAVDFLPTPDFIATARWYGGWGRSWAYRRAYYDYLPTNSYDHARYDCDFETKTCAIDLTDPSAHKLPAFRQLDLGAAYSMPLGLAALQLRLDVLNVLGRNNIADRSISATETEDRDLVYESETPRATLPRTFSLAVRLKW